MISEIGDDIYCIYRKDRNSATSNYEGGDGVFVAVKILILN